MFVTPVGVTGVSGVVVGCASERPSQTLGGGLPEPEEPPHPANASANAGTCARWRTTASNSQRPRFFRWAGFQLNIHFFCLRGMVRCTRQLTGASNGT